VSSRRLIVLLVLLALLLALFVASLGLGLRGRRGQGPALRPDLNAPSVGKLRERLSAPLKGKDLRLEEGVPGCQVRGEQLRIPVGATCTFEIAPANRTRALRPRLAQGTAANLTLEQEDALTIEVDLPLTGDEDERYDVYRNEDKKPARLTVADCKVGEDSGAELCLVSLGG
jgi:hypothetical protein